MPPLKLLNRNGCALSTLHGAASVRWGSSLSKIQTKIENVELDRVPDSMDIAPSCSRKGLGRESVVALAVVTKIKQVEV